MSLDGRVADVELAAYLGVREAPRDQAEYVELALGQLADLPWRRRLPDARELPDHALRDGGGEEGIHKAQFAVTTCSRRLQPALR